MAKSICPYSSFPVSASEVYPHGTTAHRPVALATVTASNGQSVQWIVMPDSGADACLFPLALAIVLKINILKLPKAFTGGVGSQVNVTYYDNLTIDLGNGIVFTAYVGFTQGMDQVGLGLLGQSGFFDRYNVEFLHSRKIFTIDPVAI
jgi:hypothetical protein